jgi:hypothetical protein
VWGRGLETLSLEEARKGHGITDAVGGENRREMGLEPGGGGRFWGCSCNAAWSWRAGAGDPTGLRRISP